MPNPLPSYEKLGAFYLGRRYDAQDRSTTQENILLDAKDLTTHALCVGMTGSGKTGLCISLLEEALIDGVPVIAIDPKGDLSNLLLTFPELSPAEFRPFIDEAEALRKGLSVDELATKTATQWRSGLAEWDQTADRITRLRDAADTVVYTPGSEAVRPLSVLKALSPPPEGSPADPTASRERIATTVSSLLALAGIESDPITGREHLLLTHILERAFATGANMDLGRLVMAVAKPEFDRIGVLDLETFYPAGERRELMLRLNALLASPAFAAWLRGDPLDIDQLLRSPGGKPRLTILSIAHLNDSERMFLVTLLLGELLAWMRRQPGTGSLRAIVYMDEVFGYLPPVKEPPSKQPMLALLKQARAFGLGMVLATQNPVDVDYKALSNCGTWFLGRLQTERDKQRVLDGLEGASSAAGKGLDRGQIDGLLSGLPGRCFLMNNVHDDGPVLFQTRWALSYLRGPLTLPQLKSLAGPLENTASATGDVGTVAVTQTQTTEPAPMAPPGTVSVRFLAALPGVEPIVYLPALLAEAHLHYVDGKRNVDMFETVSLLSAPLSDRASTTFDADKALPAGQLDLLMEPEQDAAFAPLPMAMVREKALKSTLKDVQNVLYRDRPLGLQRCASLKLVAEIGESKAAFAGRVAQAAREERDLAAEKLKGSYAPKLARLQERIRKAEGKLEKQQAQVTQQSLKTAVSVGTTLLGALFGRRGLSGASSAVRSAGRIAQEKGDADRAQEDLAELQGQLSALEEEFQSALQELEGVGTGAKHEVETIEIRARKSDLEVSPLQLVWLPFRGEGASRRPAFSLE